MNTGQDIFLDNSKQSDFKDYYLFGEEESIQVLPNFNSINIFVGSNNSGKSRFMRALMKQQSLKGLIEYKNFVRKIKSYNEIIRFLNVDWKKNPQVYSTAGHTIMDRYAIIKIEPISLTTSEYFQPLNIANFQTHLAQFGDIKQIPKGLIQGHFITGKSNSSINFISSFDAFLDQAIELNQEITKSHHVNILGNNLNYFIPTLRTAHSIFEENDQKSTHSKLKKDIFLDTILKNYGLTEYVSRESSNKNDNSENKKVYIFTGLHLYNQIVNARNGLKIDRKRFTDFEEFIGKEFFNTPSIDIVAQFNINEKHLNKDDNEIINIHIGDDSRNLHDLGDGIQSLIILMYSIFMAKENTIIFIDEPELNLHPGMQRLFLEQITNNENLTKKNLTYIIATHSNHLLDLTIDKNNISIYSFSKPQNNKFVIKNVNAGDNELLRELGVNNSSIFLANSSIWVEGISDRNYIKAFLLAYCKSINKEMPKEDIDFAFLEYAGSNIIHYDFSGEESENIKAFALNNRIFILSDNDAEKEEKHEKYRKLCEHNTTNLIYYTTSPYREIENLLTDNIWKKTLIDLCNKSKVKNNNSQLQDSINLKVEKIQIENYKEKYVGEYLKSLNIEELNSVSEGSKSTPKSLKSEYKSLLSKIVLDKTVDGEITWEDFSKNNTIEELIKSIYNFIIKK